MHARFAVVLAFAAALAGCPAGKPAKVIQPDPPKVGDADPVMKPPSIDACKTNWRHDLMVVDWTPELRGDLEVAMKQGIAFVTYDCKSLKLQDACSFEGSYGYIGTTRREKRIEMSSRDEIAANLPVGGLSWLSDIGAKLGRESALLAQLVMVGKQTSTQKLILRRDVQGSCDGVTHFVRAATVGAFVVASGSKAELEASAEIIGKGASAGSKSSTKIQAQDGDLEACAGSKSDDKAPPDQCGAVVRIELEPIGAGGLPYEAQGLVAPLCAPGFAWGDGACVAASKPHRCTPGDEKDCTAQCEAGDAASCATLSIMLRDGIAAVTDPKRSAELAERACDKDVILGCRTLAAAKLAGQGTAKDGKAALALLEKACEAGDGKGCLELGEARLGDKKAAADAQYAFRRACYGGGEIEGCAWLGMLYAQGKGGLTANAKLAVPFYEKACDEGSARACDGLAGLVKAGKGVPKDPKRARELYEQACNLGLASACKKK
jgi:TPR repeat protein